MNYRIALLFFEVGPLRGHFGEVLSILLQKNKEELEILFLPLKVYQKASDLWSEVKNLNSLFYRDVPILKHGFWVKEVKNGIIF